MNQEIRNKLRNVVTQCRKLLEDSIAQDLEGKFVIFARRDHVTADPNAPVTHLTDEERSARKDILDHFEHIKARGFKPKDALDQLIREIAFTHLNRLCAYKMMEARDVYVGGQKFREAVSRGVNSNGVKFYLADHPDDERLFNTGHQDIAYRHFLDWLGGLLSDEIGVLFNPNDPANRLYPRQSTLDEVLDLLNAGGIRPDETELREQWPSIWSSDETIGWVYQYFTPKELREQARKESGAPRNSYELAFRNQFFTPRYVVEFLTDNTLGRLWYEMRKGETKLKEQCGYLVRRPTEVFLNEGELPPADPTAERDDLSQEELLRLPVYLPHRSKKDPRDLRILDPASGSGHFLLYCFDLLQTIYEEAYVDTDLGPALQAQYGTLDGLRRDLPRLVLAHNLHGIDIDLRASQIAALALWLRCQRAFQQMDLKRERPTITRSNFVCAEPMPGETQLLRDFVGQLEPKLLGQIVEVVFERMKLAGEAGPLLKIEEEIRSVVAAAKHQWLRERTHAVDRKGQPLLFTHSAMDRLLGKPEQPGLFDLSGVTDAQFFEQAEANVLEALRSFAQSAQGSQRFVRTLFTDDATHGFSFVDLCNKRYDVVLMNPPFGEPTVAIEQYLDSHYPRTKNNLYGVFLERALSFCPTGFIGLISARTFVMYHDFERLRRELILDERRIVGFADLGWEVLDGAQVETAAFVLAHRDRESDKASDLLGPFIRLLKVSTEAKGEYLLRACVITEKRDEVYYVRRGQFVSLPSAPLAYWASRRLIELFSKSPTFEPTLARCGRGAAAHAFFFRLAWEVPINSSTGLRWRRLAHGGEYSPFFRENSVVIDWENDGRKVKEYILQQYPYLKGNYGWAIQDEDLYGCVGLTSGKRNERFNVQLMPAGHIFTHEGQGFIPYKAEDVWFCLGYLNSSLVSYFLALTSGLQKTWVYIRPVPVVNVDSESRQFVESASRECFQIKSKWSSGAEEAALFVRPWLLSDQCNGSLRTRISQTIEAYKSDSAKLDRNRSDLSEAILKMCDLSEQDRDDISADWQRHPKDSAFPAWRDLKDSAIGRDATMRLLSFFVGVFLGRWEIRDLTGEIDEPKLGEPFASSPVCPPGMLQNVHGLPAIQEDVAAYPLRLNWDGIFVDDPEHPDDVVRRLREVMDVIWKDRADAIEHEACEVLGVKELREYLRRSTKGGFWDDHVSLYSKSRRKAPIFWLLQSSKRNYGLWLYYQRLDQDLLFKALVNYVEPKHRLESIRLDAFRNQRSTVGESGKENKHLAKEIERQEEFISELQDFEGKLRRAANRHLKPDLNDGVVLNIAPLHELVPWKEAKAVWEELLEGKYEWSSISKQLRQKGLVK